MFYRHCFSSSLLNISLRPSRHQNTFGLHHMFRYPICDAHDSLLGNRWISKAAGIAQLVQWLGYRLGVRGIVVPFLAAAIKLVQVSKATEGSIQPLFIGCRQLFPQGKSDQVSRFPLPLLLPRVRTGGAILPSATCLHCIQKQIRLIFWMWRNATVAQSVQCDIENMVYSLGTDVPSASWGRRFLHSA